MAKEIITWDLYEIATVSTNISNVMFRGRIRKLCLNHNRNVLVENTQDVEGKVRFAVPSGEDVSLITDYLKTIIPDVSVTPVRKDIPNPVLSKLKVNIESRYTL